METLSIMAALLLGAAAQAPAQEPAAPPKQDQPKPRKQDLTELSIEELINLEVMSVSRKEQKLADVAAAISVIRGEDLRRTGVRSLPEALRMVPGMNVSRIDSNKWAVSARGFSDRFGNKLQVLVDGRSVYSPLFSGVFWDQQDTFIEDIDRIEVIRGPGAAVWGANAVNGVINVITKSAKDTHGGLIYGGGGSEEHAFGGLRVGGTSGEDVHYRAFGKGFSRDEQKDGHDEWWQARGGFRIDWDASKEDTITLLAEMFRGESGAENAIAAPPPVFLNFGHEMYEASGGHALARWTRHLGDKASVSAQLAYTGSTIHTSYFGEERDTVDFDVTHRFEPLAGHDFVWGAGYRLTKDDLASTFSVTLDPEKETDDVVSAFLQDEITVFQDLLKVTLGSRFEYNDYTQFEYQPTARVAFRPHERHLVWAAVSRAVRTPSRGENDILLTAAVIPPPVPFPPPAGTLRFVQINGNEDLKPERLLAYELGYRLQPVESLSFDLALFYNEYDDLRSTEVGTAVFVPGLPPTVFLNQGFDSKMDGRTYGLELAATWQVMSGLRLYGAYTYLRMNLDADGDSTDPTGESVEENDARDQAYVRTSVDLLESVSLDLVGRYVDVLPTRKVESYVEADVRIAWRATPNVELSVVGQNLVHDQHFESNNTGLSETATEVQRGVYFMATLKF